MSSGPALAGLFLLSLYCWSMRPGLQIGQVGELTWPVDVDETITLGTDSNATATVFSTPSMINLMEYAAREALSPYLSSDEESFGVDVRVTHLAPTRPGTPVRGVATVTSIDGRAAKLLAMPPLRETKRLIHADEGRRAKLNYHRDTAAYIRCLETEDAREGIAAFIEKRPPNFHGK